MNWAIQSQMSAGMSCTVKEGIQVIISASREGSRNQTQANRRPIFPNPKQLEPLQTVTVSDSRRTSRISDVCTGLARDVGCVEI